MFSDNKRAMECWDKEKNVGVDPKKLTKGSGKKVWLICDVCEHSFETKPQYISRGRWCPFCSSKQLCSDLDCMTCFEKSFASSSKVKFWIKEKNDRDPRFYFKSSEIKCWFKCQECSHDILVILKRINQGGWCPFCSSKQLCDSGDCTACFDKSFESHPNSKFLVILPNSKPARQIFKFSHTNLSFKCDKCEHVFLSRPELVSKGNWCSFCSNSLLCKKNNCFICFEKSFASIKIQNIG